MPGKTEQLGLLMLAVAVSSCYLSFASVYIKHVANIVRVFMTLILAVSDLNLFRVLFSGTDHALGANRPQRSQVLALIMGLTLTSLSLKLLGRRLSLTSTTSCFYSSGKECGCSGGELVLQAMKVTQGQCPKVETGIVHGPCNIV